MFSVLSAPEALGNGSSLPVQEGQSLHLVCDHNSNPPANLSWTRGSLTLKPSQPSNPGVLQLPRVELGDHGIYVCRAQHLLGSLEASLSLLVKSELQHTWEGCLGPGRWGSSDPSLVVLQNPRSCLVPPAPGRVRGCTAPALLNPSCPPLCTGGWGRGCWKGTTAMPP